MPDTEPSSPAAKPRRKSSRRLVVGSTVLLLAGLFVYLPALHGNWLWDDGFTIKDNPLMGEAGGWWKFWFAPPGPDYFPLTSTVEWGLWRVFGDHTFPFHVACLGLHLLSAFLIWALFKRLGLKLALLGALLFVVHPLAVESMAWISELKNTVSLPLLLGAMLCWLYYDDEKKQSKFYFGALVLFLAALLAKTSVVMLPFVLLLYTWWKYGRITRKKFVATIPFFAVAFVLGVLTMFFQKQWAIGTEAIDTGGPVGRAAGAGWALLFYTGKFFWPMHLMPAYPPWSFNHYDVTQLLPWLVPAGVGAVLWWRRSDPWARAGLLGLGFFALNLAPVLGFLTMSYMRIAWVADHFAYVPMIGLIGLVALGVDKLLAASPRAALPIAAGTLVLLTYLLAAQSYNYAENFRDQTALWSYTLKLNPNSWLAELNLGLSLTEMRDLPRAEMHLRKSIALHDNFYGTHMALANIVAQMGRNEEAAGEYAQALKLSPDSISAHVNYGIVLSRLHRDKESEGQYYLATLCPAQSPANLANLAMAHFNLAYVYQQQGKKAEAIRQFQAVLEIQPGTPGVKEALAKLGAGSGEQGGGH